MLDLHVRSFAPAIAKEVSKGSAEGGGDGCLVLASARSSCSLVKEKRAKGRQTSIGPNSSLATATESSVLLSFKV